MAKVLKPPLKGPSPLQKIFPAIAGALGGALGGPAGAAAGTALGGAIADPREVDAPMVDNANAQSPIDRRVTEQENSPARLIELGIQSLQAVKDPQQREALAEPLIKARMKARGQNVDFLTGRTGRV